VKRPAWLRPTLARRLISALLVAFTLLVTLILVEDQISIQKTMASDPGVRRFGRQLAAGLEAIDDAALAARVLDANLQHINRLRDQESIYPGPLLAQLVDTHGRSIYSTSPGADIAVPGVGEHTIAGKSYWTYRQDSPRWSLRLAEPALSRATLLSFGAWELGKQLLLAFPLMLLPLWVGVYTGLSPLRHFARQLRGLDLRQDLMSVDVDLRYGELQPLGKAFDALLHRLRLHRARERAFVHEAAHELRTPLAVIAAQAHVLAQTSDEVSRAIAAAALQQAIARGAHLSRQLLDLASLDNDQAAPRTSLDLAYYCADRLAEQVGVARARGIELALVAPEQLPIHVDVVALHSVLQNLLDNALRYVERGGHIHVRLELAANGPRLCVTDNGPGIAPSDRPLAFARFWRGAGHDVPGTGLGLAIVARATERLGGQITVRDGLVRRDGGCGVCFELQLPPSVLGVP
jgi:two-component system, OmpR family, sensor histidine kinase QseC